MKKILFVTTRNICNMCGEFKLIKGRSAMLKEEYCIDTDFYGFVSHKKLLSKLEPLDSRDIVAYNANPFDIVLKYKKFAKKVTDALRNGNYTAVIISGAFPFDIARLIRKTADVYIVYDCHGAWEELLEYNPTVARKLRYRMCKRSENNTLKRADAAFAVSEELKKYLYKNYGFSKKTFIIPCALSCKDILPEEAKRLRAMWREKIGVSDDETLFVYSGGISLWQSIDKAYEMFKKYKESGQKAKLLIMTPQPDAIKFEDATVMSFPSEKVSEVLFAGDVALLIRDNFITNNVAFPNKYLEYVLSTMAILSTPYLIDISSEIKGESIGVITDNDSFSPSALKAYLESREIFEKEYIKRCGIVEKYSFKNTLKPFVSKIRGTD